MADDRQKRKRFLSHHRPNVSLERTKLSFQIEASQYLNSLPFLTTKTNLS
jgi:hypothetical protein